MKYPLLAINVGNTRTTIAACGDEKVLATESLVNAELATLRTTVESLITQLTIDDTFGLILGSVNDPIATKISVELEDIFNKPVHRTERDLNIPIGRQLDPEAMTGHDRLLNAAACYDQLKQACIIIDAGTAVTVDFVDGAGTFQGGAILPGAQMMLNALSQNTAALPTVELAEPDSPIGPNTQAAIRSGVIHGLRGATRELAEAIALQYGAFPKIIATGGDAPLLFGEYELIEAIVPDLTLRGLMLTWKTAIEADNEE